MQFLPFRPSFMNDQATGYVPQLNAPVHWMYARTALVYLWNRDLIGLREHILTRTDDGSAQTFHFKIFWELSLVYFIWILTYHISRGAVASWEQGWRSGESTRLPPMCPGLDSRTRRHIWVEFVVGSRLAPRMFLRALRFSSLLKNRRNPWLLSWQKK